MVDKIEGETQIRLARAIEEVRSKKEKHDRDRLSGERNLELTEWRHERPHSVMDFSSSKISPKDSSPVTLTLDCVPLASQEHIIVGELLKIFCGGESDLIRFRDGPDRFGRRDFFLSPSIDPVHMDFAKKCLPMASNFSAVTRFIEDSQRLSSGRVNQALVSTMSEMLTDYLVFVESLHAKYRSRKLHSHELWFQIQSSYDTMVLLSDVTHELVNAKARGGQTCSLLHGLKGKFIGLSSTGERICHQLLEQCSVPFMESVVQWIFNGVIYDPFDEFMIVENPKWKKKNYSDGYWEMMYQLRPNFVPKFLEDVQYYILNAGKYLNVIRECISSENRMNLAPIENLTYSDERGYIDVIKKAYMHSSRNLLDYFLKDHNLLDKITTAKRHFLLQQGDFVVQVLDTCDDELSKQVEDVEPSTLAALVEMAMKSSKTDCFTEKFTSSLKPIDLMSQVKKILVYFIPGKFRDGDDSTLSEHMCSLTGYESFALGMKCDWPLSLVFNTKVQSVYQMLFRHLFYCKYVERVLNNSWVNMAKRNLSDFQQRTYDAAIGLRSRMQFFVINMGDYMTAEAIEPTWEEFVKIVPLCESIDDLMKCHWDFLQKCTLHCLLTNLELLSTLRHLLGLCIELGSFLSEIAAIKKVSSYPKFAERITQLEKQFNECLCLFLVQVDSSFQKASTVNAEKLLNLFNRQNPQNYYSNMLQESNTVPKND
ncbi:Spc97 / Spc98 family [Nesidiocoris tenuis]|uniref:Gamma-tubulin complex component n=1 Tax=Nesidiocoris tenuis TaxID=355587 RepID=A0ABN7ASL4_9HEMI|nr:Spc97 / Spc98 family [Nesidiocoris tenuis]